MHDDDGLLKSLGLDVELHRRIFDSIERNFRKTVLARKNRPARMAYFDGVIRGAHGERVREIAARRAAGEAAGTGRFLEVMARLLGFTLEDFGREALAADRAAAISSMCTVFAESEVVSLVAAGENRRRIALGLHPSVVDRVWPLVARLEGDGDLFFVGGVAENPAVVRLLEARFGRPVLVPPRPQIVSALGAGLLAAEGENRP